MSCLTITATPVELLTLTVTPGYPASVGVDTVSQAALTVTPGYPASVGVDTVSQADLDAGPVSRAALTVGEICTVCGEELVVLAGRDGPFRNCAGGFFLLDPARSPAD